MDDDRTLTQTVRHAARGKVTRHGRRDADRMTPKDWLGYVLAVVVPIAGSLLVMWQTMAVVEHRLEEAEQENTEQWQIIRELLRDE